MLALVARGTPNVFASFKGKSNVYKCNARFNSYVGCFQPYLDKRPPGLLCGSGMRCEISRRGSKLPCVAWICVGIRWDDPTLLP